MAELPPKQPDPAAVPAGPGKDPVPAPQLLVMPPTDTLGTMVWPGAEGEPAWAIPVQIPSGTRGYALFLPMVPVAAPPDTPSAVPPSAVTPAPVTQSAVTQAADTGPSAAKPGSRPLIPKPVGRTEQTARRERPTEAPATTAPAANLPADATPAANRPADATPTGASLAATSPAAAPAAATSPTTTSPAISATTSPAATSATATSGETGPAERAAQRTPPPPLTGAPPPFPARQFGAYEPHTSPWQRFRQRNWPGPKQVQGRAVPAGVLAGALGFLVFLPLDRVGIGWFLGWLAVAAGVAFAVRKSGALERRERLIRSGWATAALALMAVLAFRNAWWLVTFSVQGAIGCTALAIVGGRRIKSILFSLIAAPYAAFAGIPWVRRHLKGGRNPGIARRILFSVALTVVVLLVFGALLSSADVAFDRLLSEAVPDFELGSVFRWALLAAAGALLAVSGIYTLTATPALAGMDTDGRGRFGLIEWAPAGAALVLLFAGFVAVQFTVLFGGSRHVLQTAGLSYSQYARSGFWQLVAVTLLSLTLIAALARWARRDRPVERVLLRVLLGLLCALSVVIVASALSRMWEYQRVYSFTGERIFVMASELLLGVIFVMIALAGVRWNGRWIPSTTVGLAVLMLLGLAVLNPEGYVASRNAARYQGSGKIDAWYLRALSADATPALTHLPDPVRRCTLSWIAEDLLRPDPWYAWNLGRERARQALADLGPAAVGDQQDCRAADQFDLPKTRR